MFEIDPIMTRVFGSFIELAIFLLIYSVPLVFGVIVISMLTNEWLQERRSNDE
jgi:hypothetical protein